MTLSFNWVKTFKEANMAICCDMPCGADYPYPEFDIIEQDKKTVTLKYRWKPEVFKLPIRRGAYPAEFTWSEQSSAFESIFNRKLTKFRVCPINGKYS